MTRREPGAASRGSLKAGPADALQDDGSSTRCDFINRQDELVLSLTDQGIDEGFGGEFEEVVHLFAYAYEADRQVQLAGDGDGDAAFGGAVELGEDDAGDAGGLREEASLLQAVLAGGGIHHEKHFMRRVRDEARGGAAHFFELVHEAGLGVEAAGSVDVEVGDVARFSGGDGVVENGRGVAALAGLDHFHAAAGGPDFQLLDGCGAEGVGGAEEDGAVLRAAPGSQLAAGGGLAGAVDADQECDLGRGGRRGDGAAAGLRGFGGCWF